MNRVPVGPSTLALLIAAIGGASAFVVSWAESGTAPAWLAVVSAALVAILGVLRSWQAVNLGKGVDDVVDEGPVLPDDMPELPPYSSPIDE